MSKKDYFVYYKSDLPRPRMTLRWTEDETLRLINLYKSYRFLWDNTQASYRNLPLRKRAMTSIVYQMGKPNLTIQDAKCKIKNLRTSYYGEQRRLAKTGEPTSRLTWYNAFKPLMESTGLKKELDEAGVSENESFDDNVEDSPFIEDTSANSDTYVVTIKQEYLDEMENQDQEKDLATVSEYLEPAHKKMKTYELPTKEEPVEEEIVEEIVEEEAAPKKKYDEFYVFAKNIASQLRKIPLDRALIIQVEVQSLIAKERIRAFKKNKEDAKDSDLM